MSGDLGSGERERRIVVSDALDRLRQLIARVDALVHASEDLFERHSWTADLDDGEARKRARENMAHLLGAATEAIRAAIVAGTEIAVALVRNKAVV
jgi:hypothetical protein